MRRANLVWSDHTDANNDGDTSLTTKPAGEAAGEDDDDDEGGDEGGDDEEEDDADDGNAFMLILRSAGR